MYLTQSHSPPLVCFLEAIFRQKTYVRNAYKKGHPLARMPFTILEAKPGFEPGIRALQARALPLGYFAVR